MKTLAILTNGGDTCALNASIRSIRDNAYDAGWKKIYGIRRGYQGLVDGWIEDITHKEIDPRIGGSCLGSLRVSPTKKEQPVLGSKQPAAGEKHATAGKKDDPPYGIDDQRCREMATFLSDYKIDVLVVIGGDGTLQATKMFQGWVQQHLASREFRPFEIMGFLKTIDNDIRTYTHFEGVEVSLCPGFPSAVRKIASCTEDLRVTARTAERAFSIETMGRDAGWLAAAATFGGAEILLVPELTKIWKDLRIDKPILHSLVESIAGFYSKNRNVLIAVAEGFEPAQDFKGLKAFNDVIHELYGTRKKVGATELVALLVSPVLEYYFQTLSNLVSYADREHEMDHVAEKKPEKRPSPDQRIDRVLNETLKSAAGEKYERVQNSEGHPLKDWVVKKELRKVLAARNGKALSGPPYQFEIRPHRTDYLPRSGPPSSYDYRLATVLGEKIGLMLVRNEFGAVPALAQVVPYDELTLKVIKTVQIQEIATLNFGSKDYFDTEFPFQVSKRITDFFRTILSGPENLEEAISDYTAKNKKAAKTSR
jgi:6-phosphofructokinase